MPSTPSSLPSKQRSFHLHLLQIIVLSAAALLPLQDVFSQTVLERPDYFTPTKIAPNYFGPNAFPVPELPRMNFSEWRIAVAEGESFGVRGDRTHDIRYELAIPLFSDRVTLTAWGVAKEYFTNTPASIAASRIDASFTKGSDPGDLYISTDILLLKETTLRPTLCLRSVLKTASGYGHFRARYYDSPGYFFDLTASKTIALNGSFFKSLSLAASGGFLCWQTDVGRQNDAPLYGARIGLDTRLFVLEQSWGGYSGWEHDGDAPMDLRSRLAVHLHHFEPFVTLRQGLHDYPYTQLTAGLAYTF